MAGLVLILCLLPACNGFLAPDQGEGTVILNLPGAPAQGRAVLPAPALGAMRYSIRCTGPARTRELTAEGGGTIHIDLPAGSWHISVDAIALNIVAGHGEGDVDVSAGSSNTADIKMSPGGEFVAAIAAASTSLAITNTKTTEGGAYGIGEPLKRQVIATFTDGSTADVSEWIRESDLACDSSTAGTKTVGIAPESPLAGIPLDPPVTVEVKTLTDRLAWANDSLGGSYTLLLYADETMPGVVSPHMTNAAITLKSSDVSVGGTRTLQLAGDGMMFHIDTGATLTLDRNVTLRGFSPNTSPVIVSVGDLVMEEGSVITGNGSSGVHTYGSFSNGSSFTMNGGTISGNQGYGVTMAGYATFTMNGGTISDNDAPDGGGVLVNGNGAPATFIMSGGAVISGNRATTGSGGGVRLVGDVTFTMNGGTISGNEAANNGGGVSWLGSGGSVTFTMNSGTISGNEATNDGGGVYLEGVGAFGATFTMNGGTISGNEAMNGGGGVYVDGGSITLYGGKISENTVSVSGGSVKGGGVYCTGAVLELRGGEISGNSIEFVTTGSGAGSGAGVCAENSGTVRIYSGSVKNNSGSAQGTGDSGIHGTGIYMNNSDLLMEGGFVEGNTAYSQSSGGSAGTWGGGVFVAGSGSFTMKGGAIRGNYASYGNGNSWAGLKGGGVFLANTVTFTMEGGVISGNTLVSLQANHTVSGYYLGAVAGGVYISGTAVTILKTGGIIYGSEALGNDADGFPLRNVAMHNGADIDTAVVVDTGGTPPSPYAGGHAIMILNGSDVPVKWRDATADENTDLRSSNLDNWSN